MAGAYRTVNGRAVELVIRQLDHIAPSQIREVIDEYIRAQWMLQITSPWVHELAKLSPGESMVWREGARYLQTTDRDRARILLRNPKARWKAKYRGKTLTVTRLED